MIRLTLGNVGSGKTATEVWEMLHNKSNRLTYTNIIPKNSKLLPNVRVIKPEMIINSELVSVNKKGEPLYKYSLNKEYWLNIKEPINLVLDEAHTFMDAS